MRNKLNKHDFFSVYKRNDKILLEPIVLEPVKKNIENSMVEGLKILIKSLILQMITTD